MKNRRAAREKAKRREIKLQERRETAEFVFNEVQRIRKERGLTPATDPPEVMLRKYQASVLDATVHACMYSIIVTMICLSEKYGFDTDPLIRFAQYCENILMAIGTQERSAKRFAEDIEYIGVDVQGHLKSAKCQPHIDLPRKRRNELGSIHDKLLGGIVTVLYVMYYNFSWTADQINELGTDVSAMLTTVMSNDSINEYIDRLYKDTSLTADLEGNILTEDERRK